MTQNEDRWNHDRVIISFSSTWVSKINQRTVHLEWASKVVKNKKMKEGLKKKKKGGVWLRKKRVSEPKSNVIFNWYKLVKQFGSITDNRSCKRSEWLLLFSIPSKKLNVLVLIWKIQSSSPAWIKEGVFSVSFIIPSSNKQINKANDIYQWKGKLEVSISHTWIFEEEVV